MKRKKRFAGMVINNITLIERKEDNSWQCRCHCGNFTIISRANLLNTYSCGCSRRKSDEIYNEKTKERILNTITKKNGCWEWSNTTRLGYGSTRYRSKSYLAHRLSWEVFVGKIPEKMSVLHRCDNRCCVNPEHLFLGTHTDNMRDMWKKGRRSHKGELHPRHKHKMKS